jgi:hypothetical protein
LGANQDKDRKTLAPQRPAAVYFLDLKWQFLTVSIPYSSLARRGEIAKRFAISLRDAAGDLVTP